MKSSISIIFVASLLMSVNAFAKDKYNDLDTTEIEKKLKELGIPTISSVDKSEKNANALFDSGKCESAVPALKKYADEANHLANLLSSQINPYYGADHDEKKYFGILDKEKPLAQELGRLEKTSNEYKMKRNKAYVMMGECLNKLGKHKESVAILVGALELIEFKDKEWWGRARKALSSQLGLK
jgi:hypothetical protein